MLATQLFNVLEENKIKLKNVNADEDLVQSILKSTLESIRYDLKDDAQFCIHLIRFLSGDFSNFEELKINDLNVLLEILSLIFTKNEKTEGIKYINEFYG